MNHVKLKKYQKRATLCASRATRLKALALAITHKFMHILYICIKEKTQSQMSGETQTQFQVPVSSQWADGRRQSAELSALQLRANEFKNVIPLASDAAI